MGFIEERKGQQFQLMLLSAQEKLRKHTPEEICRKSGVRFDVAEGVFRLESLGQEMLVRYPAYTMEIAVKEAVKPAFGQAAMRKDIAEALGSGAERQDKNLAIGDTAMQKTQEEMPGLGTTEGDTCGNSEMVTGEEPEMWHYLTLLQYMDTADGWPLSGRFAGLSSMRGGISRGHSYERHIDTMFIREMRNLSGEDFQKACLELGGTLQEGKADISCVLHYAPNFPILINFWEADEEYPASVKMLVDEMADHYLGVEAAGAACLTAAERIHEIVKR